MNRNQTLQCFVNIFGGPVPQDDTGAFSLAGMDLSGLNLAGADLRCSDLAGVLLRGTVLRNAQLQASHLEQADLTGANLAGADLAGADLDDAILRGTDLTGANLSGTILESKRLPLPPLGSGSRLSSELVVETDHASCELVTRVAEWLRGHGVPADWEVKFSMGERTESSVTWSAIHSGTCFTMRRGRPFHGTIRSDGSISLA